MKKVYIILFYLIHLHGSSSIFDAQIFPFCDVEDLTKFDEFKLKEEQSLEEQPFCTVSQFKLMKFSLDSSQKDVEKKSFILKASQIKGLGIKISDALKYNYIYTRCLLCKTTLLVDDPLWKKHFKEKHLDLFNKDKKESQCFYDKNCNFKDRFSSLNTHLLSHIQAKVFRCNICNFVFARKSVLANHTCKKTEKSKARKISEDSDQEEDDSFKRKKNRFN